MWTGGDVPLAGMQRLGKAIAHPGCSYAEAQAGTFPRAAGVLLFRLSLPLA